MANAQTSGEEEKEAAGEEGDSAADKEAKKKKFKEYTRAAAKAYKAKQFGKAAELFQKAYEIRPVPNLLYNIGRVLEKKGDFEDAITFYEKFVNEPDVDLKARRDALDRMKTLREIVEMRKKGKEVDEEKLADEKDDRELADAKQEPKTRIEKDYTLGSIFTGSSILMLGGGAVFWALAADEHSTFEETADLEARRAAADSGKLFAALSDTFFITGGVLGVLGVYFLIDPPQEEVPIESARVVPVVTRDGAGVSFSFGF